MKNNNIKEKFNNAINKSSFLDGEVKWGLLNFVFNLLVLIICIGCIIASGQTNTNRSIIIGLVYGAYIPAALASIVFSCIVSLSTWKQHHNRSWKIWYFYLPLISIFIEVVILPIPLNLITRTTINAGMLWSVLIFGFIDLALGVANFLGIYKINLNDSTYVISSEETKKDSLEDNNESN